MKPISIRMVGSLFFLMTMGLQLSAKDQSVPTFTFVDGATLEGEFDVLLFESIAGILKIPGHKIEALRWEGDAARLTFIDGSSISGTLPDKVSCKLFIGRMDIPSDKIKTFARIAKAENALKTAKTEAAPKAPEATLFRYKVVKGETLRDIATSFITTVDKLKAVNPELKDNNLKPGIEINIPPLD